MCKRGNIKHLGGEHSAHAVGVAEQALQQKITAQSVNLLQDAGQEGQELASQNIDEYFMRLALEQAQRAFDLDEVPIGAIVVCDVSSSKVDCKNVPEISAASSHENASAQENASLQEDAPVPQNVSAQKSTDETPTASLLQNAQERLNTSGPQNAGIIAVAFNRREIDVDPASHAEFLAIERAAKKLKRWRLSDCSVYVTLEPCLMCAGLMHQARIKRCVYGAKDPKAGALGSLYKVHEDTRLNHRFQVQSGVLTNECSALLKTFFAQLRQKHSLQ